MRVVLLAPRLAPELEGGTELVARAQARELARRGHDVRIVCGSDEPGPPEPERGEVDGVPFARLRPAPDERYDLRLAHPGLTRRVLAEAEGADVAHVHHWATLSSDLVRALSVRMPTAVTLHDHLASCPRFFRAPPRPSIVCPPPGERAPCVACLRPDAPPGTDLEAELDARAEDFAGELAAAALLVAPSRHHAARCAATLGLEPGALRVVPHGLCRPAPPRADAEPWRGERPLRVLHLGNLGDAKGTGDLVAALAGLPAGRVELLLAGRVLDPADEARWRAAAGDLPLQLLGPYADLAGLVGRADLVALPSRLEESYGLVVDEARALGLPAWVSDRGALPERVGEAGRVLPAEDPAAWRAALAEVLADPGRLAPERRAAREAPRTAAEAAAELESSYERLLAENPG